MDKVLERDRPALGTPHQFAEKAQSFADGLTQLSQRWDNRIVVKKTSLAKLYIDGRVVVLVDTHLIARHDGAKLVVCINKIVAAGHPAGDFTAYDVPYREIANPANCDCRDDEVVLIDLINLCEAPKDGVSARVGVRFYLIEDKVFRTGEGHLYVGEGLIGYKVLPRLVEREVIEGGVARVRPYQSRGQVVQSAPEVVYDITDKKAEIIRDWTFWLKNQFPHVFLRLNRFGVELLDENMMPLTRKVGSGSNDFIEVALGPLDL